MRLSSHVAAFLVLALLALISSFASAQQTAPQASDIPGAASAPNGAGGPSELQKGTWEVAVYGAAAQEHKRDQTIVYGAVGCGYFFWNNVGADLELVYYDVRQSPGSNATGLGANLLAEWDFLRVGRATFLGQLGVGVVEFDGRVPDPDGTWFNFTAHGNLGMRVRIFPSVHLLVVGKYMHISNLAIEGDERNGGVDTLGGYAGLAFPF